MPGIVGQNREDEEAERCSGHDREEDRLERAIEGAARQFDGVG